MTEQESPNGDNEILNRKLRHDLQAQLINMKGFCGEIERAASELMIYQKSDSCQNTEYTENLERVITDDILPCIKFLSISTEKLDQLIVGLCSSVINVEKQA
ncbi:hypothetical protein AB833_09290 [Chromatiales bacterium (ex Bugula neritina AB1)]|nr:hypothetical protein AB833_09290 [Chromatiales bacterium (ex Bugula neritina AB1)]